MRLGCWSGGAEVWVGVALCGGVGGTGRKVRSGVQVGCGGGMGWWFRGYGGRVWGVGVQRQGAGVRERGVRFREVRDGVWV